MSDDPWAPPEPAQARSAGGSPVEVAGYTDLVEIARGGDSIVYRARQVSLDRDVAIKVVQLSDPSVGARFQRELAITVRLGRAHPHIVTVLDTTETANGEPCLIMDFHDLGSLHDRLTAGGPLSVSEVVDAGTAVADALAFAHAAGVLHRDVKPQNILVLPTSYVLSDFGIARRVDAGHTASLERFSYRHASPQVLDGHAPTAADDVWSLGSTLFTLLDGRAPFASDDPDDDSALAYLRRVRLGRRRVLHRTDVPATLLGVIEGCLALDREERIASADEALARLRAIRTEDRSWEPAAAPASAPADPPASAVAPPVPTAAAPVPSERASARQASPPSVSAGPASAAAATDGPVSTDADTHRPIPAASGPAPAASPVSSARSRSALADIAAEPATLRPATPDDDVTGVVAAPAQPGADSTSPSPPGRGWRRVAFFLSGMLLAGAAVGVATALVQAPRDSPQPSHSPIDQTVPDIPPVGPTGGSATVSNPEFAPKGLVVTDNGTSALLTWSAPSRSVQSIVVVGFDADDRPVAVADLNAAATEYTAEGLDPDGTSCFAVVGYGSQDGAVEAGSTEKVCTD